MFLRVIADHRHLEKSEKEARSKSCPKEGGDRNVAQHTVNDIDMEGRITGPMVDDVAVAAAAKSIS